MKQTKRILSLLLAVMMTVSLLTIPASATTDASVQEEKAKVLSALGLFKGYDNTGANFGLSDGATREQSLLFLIRILGEEKAAEAWRGTQPYSDVSSGNYFYPYVGYAKSKGYTNGIGNNQFGIGQSANITQMAAFALRGLGYSEAAGDFTYQNSVPFALSLGVVDSTAVPTTFTRGDAVDILDGAVATAVKGQSYTLLEKLVNDGAVTQAQVEKAAAIAGGTPTQDKGDTAASKPTQGEGEIAAGTYTLKCMGNNLRVTSDKLELRNTSPAQVFTISNEDGYDYIQTADGSYLGITALTNGTQLVTGSSPYSWLIQKQSGSTYTIRSAEKQELIVNASEQKSANGTKMIVWTHSGAPKNTLITFTSATNAKNAAVTGIKLDQTTAKVAVGSTTQLTGTISPSNATNQNVTWTSSSSTIAKVDGNGVVTGVKAGTATITAKTVDGNKTATCKVTVTAAGTKKVAVTGVKLDQTTANVALGRTIQLTGTISPANATNQNVTWSSNASTVARVDGNGVVIGVNPGIATITAKTVDGGKIATCKVTVTDDQKMTKSAVTIRNQTGKSITELYITDSALSSYDNEFLKANSYKSFSDRKTITTTFEFDANTKFDILLRFADGTEAEALDLSFSKATTAPCNLTLGTKDVKLARGSLTLASVNFENKANDLDAPSKALADRYNKSIARYNTLIAECKKLKLDNDPAFVAGMNAVTDELDKMHKTIGEGVGVLTAAQIKEFNANLNDLDAFMTQMEALIKSASAKPDKPDMTATNKAVAAYNTAVTTYNKVVADAEAQGLGKNPDVARMVNQLSASITAMSAEIDKHTNTPFTAEQVTQCSGVAKDIKDFTAELQKLIDTAKTEASKPANRTVTVTLINNTILDITHMGFSPSTVLTQAEQKSFHLKSGATGTVALTYTTGDPLWDLEFRTGDGNSWVLGDAVTFKGISFTNCPETGGIITLTTNEQGASAVATINW